MSKFNQEKEKSIRVVLPLDLYEQLKKRCGDYGDISRVIRYLLKNWIESDGRVRQVYDQAEELKRNLEETRKQAERLKSSSESIQKQFTDEDYFATIPTEGHK